MEAGTISQTLLCVCEECLYFRQEEWEMGYCRFHHIYVLKTFDCSRFTPKGEHDEHALKGVTSHEIWAVNESPKHVNNEEVDVDEKL